MEYYIDVCKNNIILILYEYYITKMYSMYYQVLCPNKKPACSVQWLHKVSNLNVVVTVGTPQVLQLEKGNIGIATHNHTVHLLIKNSNVWACHEQ